MSNAPAGTLQSLMACHVQMPNKKCLSVLFFYSAQSNLSINCPTVWHWNSPRIASQILEVMFSLLPCLSVEKCLRREQSIYFSLLFTESVPMARRTLAGTRPLHHPSIASLVQQPPHQTPNWLTGRNRSAFHSSCRTLCGYGWWNITHPVRKAPVWTNVQIPQFNKFW